MGKQTTEAAWVGQPAWAAQTRRNAGLLGAAFALTLGLVAIGAAGMWSAVELGLVDAGPASCEAAEAAAEDMAFASAAVGRAAEDVQDGETVDLDALRVEWNAAYEAYADAAADCRAAGGDI